MEEKVNVRKELTDLNVGDRVSYSIAKTKSVRAQASDLGLILDRVYKTCTSRENRTITVTRVQ